MATEVLKEFLVKLGYAHDTAGLKKFTDSVDTASRTVTSFIHALEAVVTGVLATRVMQGFQNFAASLEGLYFESRRIGASAASLKILDRAAQELGFSAGEAVSALENFALTLKQDPGALAVVEGGLRSMGQQLKRNKDGTIDYLDAFIKYTEYVKKNYGKPGQEFVGFQFAGMAGISPSAMNMLMQGDLSKEMGKVRRELGGINLDKIVADAHRFEETFRSFKLIMQAFGMQVIDALQTKLGGSLADVNNWLLAHGQEITDKIVKAATGVVDAVTWSYNKLKELYDWFEKLDTKTKDWTLSLAALGLILKETGAGSVAGGVLNLTAAFVSLAARFPVAMLAITATTAALTALYAAVKAWQGEDASNRISNLINKLSGGGASSKFGDMLDWFGGHIGARSVRNMNPGNLKFAGQAGAHPAEGGFASFDDVYSGLYALGKQLEIYAGRGKNTIASILGTYAPAAGGNDVAAYIADVTRRTGFGANQPLNMQNPDTLAALMNAMIWHENAMNLYDPGMVRGAAGQAIQIHQKVDINVYGDDSTTVANRVMDKLRTLTQESTRNVGSGAE